MESVEMKIIRILLKNNNLSISNYIFKSRKYFNFQLQKNKYLEEVSMVLVIF